MTVGGNPQDSPSTEGAGYGAVTLPAANQPTEAVPSTTETTSVLIRADINNSGAIYIGYDDQVTTANGLILDSGESVSLNLDISSQDIYFVGANAGDQVRWLATE